MKRNGGVNLPTALIRKTAAAVVFMLVTRAAAIDFTRTEDSLGNLDIYEVYMGNVQKNFFFRT